ncbi:MAG: hypothetical protein OXT67_07405 [Zetaproteobacteria bacterium]|nr:hypothetical protein [Zetaproteobacteria bacterium]
MSFSRFFLIGLVLMTATPLWAMEPQPEQYVQVPLQQYHQQQRMLQEQTRELTASQRRERERHERVQRLERRCVRFSSAAAVVSAYSSAGASALDGNDRLSTTVQSYATDLNDVKDLSDFLAKVAGAGLLAIMFDEQGSHLDPYEKHFGLLSLGCGLGATALSAVANHAANHQAGCTDTGKLCWWLAMGKNGASLASLGLSARAVFFSPTAVKRPYNRAMKIAAAQRTLAKIAWGWAAIGTVYSCTVDIKPSLGILFAIHRDGGTVSSALFQALLTSERFAQGMVNVDNRWGLGWYEDPGDKLLRRLPQNRLSQWLRSVRDAALRTGQGKGESLPRPRGGKVLGLELEKCTAQSPHQGDKVIVLIGHYAPLDRAFTSEGRWVPVRGQGYPLPADALRQVAAPQVDEIDARTQQWCRQLRESLALGTEIVYDPYVRRNGFFYHGGEAGVIQGGDQLRLDVLLLVVPHAVHHD